MPEISKYPGMYSQTPYGLLNFAWGSILPTILSMGVCLKRQERQGGVAADWRHLDRGHHRASLPPHMTIPASSQSSSNIEGVAQPR
jgi:hypothetical protein